MKKFFSPRLMLANLLLVGATIFTLLGLEQFPFSNYPMYAKNLRQTIRLTLVITEKPNSRRVISTEEIKPVGRIHLGLMLQKFTEGNAIAVKNVEKLVRGLFMNNLSILQIEIVKMNVGLPLNDDQHYSLEELSIEKKFYRYDFNL